MQVGENLMPSNNWIEADFEGLDGVVRQLEKIKSEVESHIDKVMLRAALKLEDAVIMRITNYPVKSEGERGLVDTGTLRASVHSFVRKRFGLTEGVVGTNMEYAPFLEYGTGVRGAESNHPNKPADYTYGDHPGIKAYKFMWTAWEETKEEIKRYVLDELGKVVAV
jgi:HK97 gp10 family phage protein